MEVSCLKEYLDPVISGVDFFLNVSAPASAVDLPGHNICINFQ